MSERFASLPPSAALPLEKIRVRIYMWLIALDIVALFVAVQVANFAYKNPATENQFLHGFQATVVVYMIFGVAFSLYSPKSINAIKNSIKLSIQSLVFGEVVVIIISYASKSSENMSRGHALFVLVYGAICLICVRLAANAVLRRLGVFPVTNVLYVRDGAELPDVRHRHYCIDLGRSGVPIDYNSPESMHVIGGYLKNMDRVVVACPPERRHVWSVIMKSLSMQGEIIDDETYVLGATGVYKSQSYSSLIVSLPPLGLHERIMKRAFDIAFAGGALVLFSPLLVVIAALVKLEDGGPVFFVQQRTGRNNRFFRMYKFRSMRVEKLDPDGARSTAADDDRVTRIGRFIRGTSIDEFPQLINVLLGDMSIVGPRPHAIASRAGGLLFWEVDKRYWQRHALKPGLTGLAQVRGLRGTTNTENDLLLRLQADLNYVRDWSLWNDIAIVVMTIRVIVHRNAY